MPRITKILHKLITTEKSTGAKDSQNKYTFVVHNNAGKNSVKKEINAKYKVEVEEVNIMIIPGKKRRMLKTNRFIRTPKWKKAVVKIKEGQKIEEEKDKPKKSEKSDKKEESKK
jgi:large subunit ribosomal protein L23